ncbi:MAG: hypothetical protein PV344_04195, partial [Anaplasma sp.]|nr:hypothetical protein [Anaplasma sp.]
MLTHWPNCSRVQFFANRRRFAKFAKIRSSRKFSRLQYLQCSAKTEQEGDRDRKAFFPISVFFLL